MQVDGTEKLELRVELINFGRRVLLGKELDLLDKTLRLLTLCLLEQLVQLLESRGLSSAACEKVISYSALLELLEVDSRLSLLGCSNSGVDLSGFLGLIVLRLRRNGHLSLRLGGLGGLGDTGSLGGSLRLIVS